MKQKAFLLLLVLSLGLCVCAHAAASNVSIQPARLGFGSIYQAFPVSYTKTVSITNQSSETVYLKQPECSIATLGPLSKTELAAGECATFSVTMNSDLPLGWQNERINVYDLSGALLGYTDIQCYIDERPPVYLTLVPSEGCTMHLTSEWQHVDYHYFLQSGFDIQVFINIRPYYKPGSDFAVKINGKKADVTLQGHQIELNFLNLCEDTSITVEGLVWDNMPTVELPDDLTSIEDNAFQGTFSSLLLVPNGCESIGTYAFAHSSLMTAYIPASVHTIGDYAFDSSVQIVTTEGSYAQIYAANNNLDCIIRDELYN